jgi:hypothetical protein
MGIPLGFRLRKRFFWCESVQTWCCCDSRRCEDTPPWCDSPARRVEHDQQRCQRDTTGSPAFRRGAVPPPAGASPICRGASAICLGASPLLVGASASSCGAGPFMSGASSIPRGASPIPRGASPIPRGASPIRRGARPIRPGASPPRRRYASFPAGAGVFYSVPGPIRAATRPFTGVHRAVRDRNGPLRPLPHPFRGAHCPVQVAPGGVYGRHGRRETVFGPPRPRSDAALPLRETLPGLIGRRLSRRKRASGVTRRSPVSALRVTTAAECTHAAARKLPSGALLEFGDDLFPSERIP